MLALVGLINVEGDIGNTGVKLKNVAEYEISVRQSEWKYDGEDAMIEKKIDFSEKPVTEMFRLCCYGEAQNVSTIEKIDCENCCFATKNYFSVKFVTNFWVLIE